MPNTTCIKLIAVAALAAACTPAPEPVDPILAGTPSAELDFAARGVAEDLSEEIGPAGGGALTDVTRDGGTVVAVVEVPVPGADLSSRQRDAAAAAIRDTFVADVCGDAGLDAFFALGGVLEVRAIGNDGASLAGLPVSSCV